MKGSQALWPVRKCLKCVNGFLHLVLSPRISISNFESRQACSRRHGKYTTMVKRRLAFWCSRWNDFIAKTWPIASAPQVVVAVSAAVSMCLSREVCRPCANCWCVVQSRCVLAAKALNTRLMTSAKSLVYIVSCAETKNRLKAEL